MTSAKVTLQDGRMSCALLTFTVDAYDPTAEDYTDLLMSLEWRSDAGSGYEPPGFFIDGAFERP